MPASHDHDDEAYDAADDGAIEVTIEEENQLRQDQLDYLKARGF